jgi:hypothetical protein
VLVLFEVFSETELPVGELWVETECDAVCFSFIGAATTTGAARPLPEPAEPRRPREPGRR